MRNEVMSNNEIKEMLQITAMNQKSISEQMGIVASAVKQVIGDMGELKNQMNEFGERMQGYEDRIRVDRTHARRLKNAIHARVNYLLNIEYKNGVVTQSSLYADKYYRSGFITRCYTDARNHSRLGSPYTETYNKDYEETMSYINGWEPEMSFNGVSGVAGYMMYLDERRKTKREK